MSKNNISKIVIIIASILAVALLGSILVNIGMSWYMKLNRPTQWIPNIVIPIAWTIIYILTTLILTIWSSNGSIPLSTRILFVLNGICNVLWCLVFYTLHLTLLGNIVIILNLILGYYLVLDIKKNVPLFALILSIYPIWLSIATTLNTAIWILN